VLLDNGGPAVNLQPGLGRGFEHLTKSKSKICFKDMRVYQLFDVLLVEIASNWHLHFQIGFYFHKPYAHDVQ
jgi:hypothetical protein